MRVLLVEDEKGISSAICQVLKKENFAIDPVYTGPDGLDWALDGNYDAIILDVMLPGMDGFQVLKRIREQGVKTPGRNVYSAPHVLFTRREPAECWPGAFSV